MQVEPQPAAAPEHRGYAVAVVATLAALLARFALDPLLANHLPYVTFFVAVAVVVWYSRGLGPSLVAIALGAVASEWFFAEPRYTWEIPTVQAQVGLATYFLVTFTFVGLGNALHNARQRAETVARERDEQRERLRTTLASIGDAVITTDAVGRIDSLNPVAESLTGWSSGEALSRRLDEVFSIVNEETRERVENPVEKALALGNVVGLANHTLLIGKDGTERPIDDSAAPIRSREGQVVGCVLVFRDVSERRQAERRTADALSYVQNIVDTMPEPFLVLDDELRVRTVSRAFCQTFHVTAEETQGQRLYDLGNRQWDVPSLRLLLEGVLTRNAVFNDYEVEHAFPAIGRRAMLLNARPIHRQDGHTKLVLLAISDVTARKHMHETERRLAAIVESSDDAIVGKSLDGVIQTWNAAAERLFGYTAEEAVGRHISFLIPPDRAGEEDRILTRLRAGERVDHFETVRLRSDGREVQVSLTISPITDVSGRVIGASKIARDITERKRLERSEREGERRLRFVIDSMPQKIFTATPGGELDYFNPIWTEFTGLPVERIRARGWAELVHPDDVAESLLVWRHSLETGAAFQIEHRFRNRDGEYLWHVSRAVPIRDESRRIVMWIGSNTDIHEQRQTADRLRQLATELSDADRRKNEFLALLAHELRNPLAPIRNAVRTLRLKRGGSETLAAASELLERQVGQMVRLVDDLLDVSRISRGKTELRRERVELASVVSHAVEAVRSLAESLDHDLTVSVPQQPIYLDADPLRLTQVLGNLLNNACKFTDRGGRIALAVERAGEQAVIRVRDNGIGIASEQLPLIFDMFMQVDTSLERSASGLGLGLTLVKNLVEMHGGTVEATSAGVGRGSEFVVRLPLLATPTAALPRPQTGEPRATEARRILVVDDNRDSATSLALLLRLNGHEAHTAYDGAEALETAADIRPEVVLLDLGLPKLNGYEVARRIREEPWGKGVVLIALTGWGQEEARHRSRESGFDHHLVKPVDDAELRKLLATVPPA